MEIDRIRTRFDNSIDDVLSFELFEENGVILTNYDALKKEIVELTFQSEIAYKNGIIEGKILSLGLENYRDEIIEGMINSQKIKFTDVPININDDLKQAVNSYRMLQKSILLDHLDYIDRFVMYNDLFSKMD